MSKTTNHQSCSLDDHWKLYEAGLQCCPLCNEWLVMRSNPELKA